MNVLNGSNGDEVGIKFTKWDDSESAFVELLYTQQTRVINTLQQGGNRVGYFTMAIGTTLDKNDYIFMSAKNVSGTDNITVDVESFYQISAR